MRILRPHGLPEDNQAVAPIAQFIPCPNSFPCSKLEMTMTPSDLPGAVVGIGKVA